MFSQPEIWFLIIGVFLGFFTQTILSFAAALVAFPFLLRVYTLPEAIAFLSFYYVIFSIVLIYKNRKDVDWQVFKDLAVAMILGVLVGLFILKSANSIWLERALGVFLVVYSIYEWKFEPKVHIPKRLFQFFGFLGGITGGVFNSGGSVYGPLVSARIKNGTIIRATLLALFGISNFIRFGFVASTSLLTREIFMQSLVIFPVFLLAVLAGHVAFKYVSERLLKNLMLVFFIVSGVFLMLK